MATAFGQSHSATARVLSFTLIFVAAALPPSAWRASRTRVEKDAFRAIVLSGEDFAWPETAAPIEDGTAFLGIRPRGRRSTPPRANSGGGQAVENSVAPSMLKSVTSRSSAQARSAEVLYNHLPKAGGSFLKKVLRDSVGRDRFILEREFDALSVDNVSDATFTIGSVRNPCEYYVSLWAFGSEGKGSFHAFVNRYDKDLHAATVNKDTQEDINRFRRWVSAIVTPPTVDSKHGAVHVGLESARFAFSYSRDRYMEDDKVVGRLSHPPREFTAEDVHHVETSLAGFNRSSIDCWVRAENMVSDTKRCLDQYASRGGRVDWRAFTDAVGIEDRNPSNHAPCAAYFDPATEALVRRLEAPIFDLFDYGTCCVDAGL